VSTDRQTDRRTERRTDSSIPPLTLLWGVIMETLHHELRSRNDAVSHHFSSSGDTPSPNENINSSLNHDQFHASVILTTYLTKSIILCWRVYTDEDQLSFYDGCLDICREE
jgi:hypothetical protein